MVENVYKEVGKNFSLGPISFHLEAGYIYALIGENGAGKSTLLRLFTNFLKPGSGQIKWEGISYQENPQYLKEKIAYVSQEYIGCEEFTCKETIELMKIIYPDWHDSYFHYLEEQLKIPLDKKIEELSLGVKKRFSLAVALSRPSHFLILDEPSASLDLYSQPFIYEQIAKYMERSPQQIVLIASHSVQEIEKLADFLIFIDNGKLEKMIEKDELKEKVKRIWVEKNVMNEDLQGSYILKAEKNVVYSGDVDGTLLWLAGKKINVHSIEGVPLDEIIILLEK